MKRRISHALRAAVVLGFIAFFAGCSGPSITAVRLSQGNPGEPKEPPGVPFYLPKPYLIVTKNIRYIPTPTVGLTTTVPIPASFDAGNPSAAAGKGNTNNTSATPPKSTTKSTSQEVSGTDTPDETTDAPAPSDGTAAKKGGSNTNSAGGTPTGSDSPAANPSSGYGSQVLGPTSFAVVPPASIPDGVVPQEFFTYQIVYMPDLTQKYGLRIKGNFGELRATENLVNGWMHTGPGPLYMRNSTTAETVAATGQAVASVMQSAGQVALSAMGIPSLGGGGSKASATKTAGTEMGTVISNYAILYIFEPVLTDRTNVIWRQVCTIGSNPISFDRDFMGLEQTAPAPAGPAPSSASGLENPIKRLITTRYTNYVFTGLAAAIFSYGTTTVTVTGQVENADGTSLTPAETADLEKDIKERVFAYLNLDEQAKTLNIAQENITVKLTSPPKTAPALPGAPGHK